MELPQFIKALCLILRCARDSNITRFDLFRPSHCATSSLCLCANRTDLFSRLGHDPLRQRSGNGVARADAHKVSARSHA
ncbi:MAG: hypothetical protein ACK5BE_06735, partial [Alphaproteobacteria bacterium]